MKSDKNIPQETTTKERSFTLPAILDLETVETVVKETAPWLEEQGLTLTLDASPVDIIMAPGVQLLLSINKTLVQSGGKLIVKQPSEFFVSIFKSLGLLTLLAQWENPHA